MTSTDVARPHNPHARRRPFSNWLKRVANLKGHHGDSESGPRRATDRSGMKNKKMNGHPYPMSRPDSNSNGRLSFNPPSSVPRSRHSSFSNSKHSMSHDGQLKSRAPTLATTAETTVSGEGTISTTAARTDDDGDSTFSSPAPSLRSMTTTLTTLQSTTAAGGTVAPPVTSGVPPVAPYAQPMTAVPMHLTSLHHPTTYREAIANSMLSDDASVLTLASSSKRRRRSADTNASMRAIPPASMFGGSRESLPLSVLSGTVISPGGVAPDTASIRDTASLSSHHYPRSTSAVNAERSSLISANGIAAPLLASERNSYIGSLKYDQASVRSGFFGNSEREGASSRAERPVFHVRNDSLGGNSIGASSLLKERSELVTAPTSPMPA